MRVKRLIQHKKTEAKTTKKLEREEEKNNNKKEIAYKGKVLRGKENIKRRLGLVFFFEKICTNRTERQDS